MIADWDQRMLAKAICEEEARPRNEEEPSSEDIDMDDSVNNHAVSI